MEVIGKYLVFKTWAWMRASRETVLWQTSVQGLDEAPSREPSLSTVVEGREVSQERILSEIKSYIMYEEL